MISCLFPKCYIHQHKSFDIKADKCHTSYMMDSVGKLNSQRNLNTKYTLNSKNCYIIIKHWVRLLNARHNEEWGIWMKEIKGKQESQGKRYKILAQNFLPNQVPLSEVALPFYFMAKKFEIWGRPKSLLKLLCCSLSSVHCQHRQRAGAQHGTRPRQLVPWCHSHTAQPLPNVRSAGGFTQQHGHGADILCCCQLGQRSPSPWAAGASRELLLPAGSGLGGCQAGSGLWAPPGPPWSASPGAAGAQDPVCHSYRGWVQLGRHCSHAGEPSSLWSLADKDTEAQSVISSPGTVWTGQSSSAAMPPFDMPWTSTG